MTQNVQKTVLSLLADIGGTNTRIAIAKDGVLQPDSITRYKNASYDSFDDLLHAYLGMHGDIDFCEAAIALAGPVQDGKALMTNLNWRVEESRIAAQTKAEKVLVLNDLQAQGYALDEISESDVTQVLAGPNAGAHATRLVVGLGTGFNAVPVYYQNALFVPPSECGHALLPYLGKTESALAEYVAEDGALPSIEDVLSGDGLAKTYAFCAQMPKSTPPPHPSQVIAAAAGGTDPVARTALTLFTRVLGSVLGDCALSSLPVGGIFLVGGVARAIAPYLDTPEFEAAFRNKGPMQDLMGSFSISLICNDYAALSGGLKALAQLK